MISRNQILSCSFTHGGRLLLLAGVGLAGCEVDNYLDPSKTGYFEFAPTTMPILERLDVIEEPERPFGEITEPNAEDLVPSSLEYKLAPGDIVRCEIYELVAAGQQDVSVRVVDQAGEIRLPTLGNMPAAGLTLEGMQQEIEDRLRGLITDPLVTVALESGRSFQFTIYGAVSGTGIYSLDRPDFRVMNALALAGGTSPTTQNLFVIREVALTDLVKPSFERENRGETPDSPETTDPADINDLINQLGGGDDAAGDSAKAPAAPGMVAQQDDQAVDLDDLLDGSDAASTQADDSSNASSDLAPRTRGQANSDARFGYDRKQRRWVAIAGGQAVEERLLPVDGEGAPIASYATRIIQVDYQRLARGDSNLNVVIRPGDRIYVESPLVGVVYFDGEIARPGVIALPTSGRLTLSRAVSAAGGLGPIAIPERVDVVRRIGKNREAVIRVNLSAIRNKSEPDIYMQPDDHVIVGTNFFAQPLAIIRNGFRASYGFGFLLDRNFGNDVFGPPPIRIVQ